MPLYDYLCEGCGSVQEHVHAMNADAPSCPECGGRLERLISAPRVVRVTPTRAGQPFYSEEEIEASYGEDWRGSSKDKGREGGERKKMYFD